LERSEKNYALTTYKTYVVAHLSFSITALTMMSLPQYGHFFVALVSRPHLLQTLTVLNALTML